MAKFAELLFAYIDELSAASVAGHTDELTTSGRVRERYRERLGQQLLARRGRRRADRRPRPGPSGRCPISLTAVLLPAAQARRALAVARDRHAAARRGPAGPRARRARPARSRCCSSPTPTGPAGVAPAAGARRPPRRRRAGPPVGARPARPTTVPRAPCGVARPTRAGGARSTPRSTWPTWSLTADPEAVADLRARVLAPLGRPRTAARRDRLAETLRSWLLHQGRRDAVAAELHVHAQTVRYRMGQLRELYGDRLDDPAVVRELVIALSAPSSTTA